MSDRSEIIWTDATLNPVFGCTKCSPGCLNCFAERMACRLAGMGQENYSAVVKWTGGSKPPNSPVRYCQKPNGGWNNKVICDESILEKPLHWKQPRRIFVCSMADLFHPKVPKEFIAKVLDVACKAYIDRGHTLQFLTKRPERMKFEFVLWSHLRGNDMKGLYGFHLGVSVCTQKEADEKIPILLQIPAAKRFVSIEPMLGEVDLRCIIVGPRRRCVYDCLRGCAASENGVINDPVCGKVDHIIVGAESPQPKMRYCDPEWIRSIVQQCKVANVPVLVKQIHIGAPEKFRLSKKPEEWPVDLRVRQEIK